MPNAAARALRDDEHREPAAVRRLRLVQDDEDRAPIEAGGEPGVEHAPTYARNGRRSVKIKGQPVPPRRRRSAAASQIEARPDRIALWAVLLGLFLVFMAAATANAAPL